MCPNFVEFYRAAADGNVMARNYFGASGEATVGAGLGANVLLGGRQDGFEVFTSSHRITGSVGELAPAWRRTVRVCAGRTKTYRIGLPPVTAMVAPET